MPFRNRDMLPENHTGPHPFLPFPGDESDGGAGGQETGEDTEQDGGDAPGAASGVDKDSTDEDWKGRARTWERRAQNDARELTRLKRELETVRQSQMSDAEKAVETARLEGEKKGREQGTGLLVQARLEAALAHLDDEARDALIDGVNTSRFIGDDGNPDSSAIKTWAGKVAPRNAQALDLGQGRRPASKPTDMNSIIRRAAGL